MYPIQCPVFRFNKYELKLKVHIYYISARARARVCVCADWDILVNILTEYGLDDRSSISGRSGFLLTTTSKPSLGPT